MKKLLTVLAFLWLPFMAYGADLPLKGPILAPAPVWSWTGFYVGGTAGYGWSSTDHDLNIDGNTATVSTNSNGFIGGLLAGYNWQFNNWLVLGAETDISWAGIKGSSDISGKFGTVPFVANVEDKTHWLGTTRGRIGFLPWQSVMIYGTGGLAYGNVETSVSSCFGCSSLSSSFATSGSVSETRVGWTAGAGVEWAMTNSWLVRGEYLHYDLGTSSLFTSAASAKHDGNIVRAGIAYKF